MKIHGLQVDECHYAIVNMTVSEVYNVYRAISQPRRRDLNYVSK